MMPEPGAFLLLLLLGGVVAVDGTSLGQFMVSRPVVAATLAGWIVGAPAEGALVGLVLEAFQLTVLPVGAARYAEGGPAAVAAAAVYVGGEHGFPTLLVVMILALVWEWVGGLTVLWIRQLNVRLSPPPQAVALGPGRLERRHLAAVGADFLRGAALVGVGVALLGWIVEDAWFLLPHGGVARLAVGAALAAALGAALRLFGAARLPLFLAGAAGGLLLLWIRP